MPRGAHTLTEALSRPSERTTQINNRFLKTMELWGMSLENVYVEWNRNAYQEWKAERAPELWQEKARREFEIDEAVHKEKVTHIKSDAARERQKKDSQQEISELSELMKIKEMINQQKIEFLLMDKYYLLSI